MKPGNGTTAAPRRRDDRALAWAALDALPAELRRATWEGVIPWSPVETMQAYRQRMAFQGRRAALRIELRDMQQADAAEVAAFAARHRDRFGQPTPHVRAAATILRYDSARPQSPRRRRLLDPPMPRMPTPRRR